MGAKSFFLILILMCWCCCLKRLCLMGCRRVLPPLQARAGMWGWILAQAPAPWPTACKPAHKILRCKRLCLSAVCWLARRRFIRSCTLLAMPPCSRMLFIRPKCWKCASATRALTTRPMRWSLIAKSHQAVCVICMWCAGWRERRAMAAVGMPCSSKGWLHRLNCASCAALRLCCTWCGCICIWQRGGVKTNYCLTCRRKWRSSFWRKLLLATQR